MPLPVDLHTVTVTGTFTDASGTPLSGTVTFTPVAVAAAGAAPQPVIVTDSTGQLVIGATGVTGIIGPQRPQWAPQTPVPWNAPQSWPVVPLSLTLVATDNADLSPQGWAYQVVLALGTSTETFTTLLESSPSTIDFSQLVPASIAVSQSASLPITGGTLSGKLTLDGTPPLQIPSGAAAGDVLASDSSGNASWATLASLGAAPLASPALTGSPTAPTQTPGDSSTKIATDAFVAAAVAPLVPRAAGSASPVAPLAYVNPKDDGAVFNGSTDDSAAINTTLARGSTIQFPPGTTSISANMLRFQTSNVHIRGAGMYDTTVKCANGSLAAMWLYPASGFVSQIELSDMTIDAGGTAVPEALAMIGSRLDRLRIRRCRFVNFQSIIIFGGYAAELIIEDCEADGAGLGQGTFLTSTNVENESVILRRNRLRWLNTGITIGSGNPTGSQYHSAYIDISDNYIDLGWWLLKAASSNSGGTVSYTGTTVTDSSAPFGSTNSIAAGTTIRALTPLQTGTLTTIGTQVTDGSANFTGNNVWRGHIVRSGSAFGVVSKVETATQLHVEEWLSQTTYQPVTPPSSAAYTIYGVVLGATVSNTSTAVTVAHGGGGNGGGWYDLRGNSVTPSAGTLYEVLPPHPVYPIFCNVPTEKIKIHGNTVRRGWADNIEFFGSRGIITGNIVEDGQDEGIVCEGFSTTFPGVRNVISDNICRHNGTSGLNLINQADCEVGPNQLEDNTWGAPSSLNVGQLQIAACVNTTVTGGRAASSSEAAINQVGLQISGSATSGVKVIGWSGHGAAVGDIYVASNVPAGACDLLDVDGIIAYQGTTNGQRLRAKGTGSPSLIASPGSVYLSTSGSGNGTALYVKESGGGSSGWNLASPPSFSPLAYGAKGDGATDDTTALQNCATAAVAAKGVIDLGTLTYKTSSPISITTGFHMKGAGYLGGTIVTNASDIFSVSGSASYVTFEGCNFTSNTGGGHIWNAGTASMSFWKILGCVLTQNTAGKSIWSQTGGLWIDCLVDQNTNMFCVSTATVSPWSITGVAGGINSVRFARSRCTANGAPVPFFLIDPGSAAGWNEEVVFDHITFEVTTGGAIAMTGCVDVVIDTCSLWDIPNARSDSGCGTTNASKTVTDASAASGDLGKAINGTNIPAGSVITAVSAGTGYTISQNASGTGSGLTLTVGGPAANQYSFTRSSAGYATADVQVRGGRANANTASAGTGYADFFADSHAVNILVDSFGSWGTAAVITSPAAQTTIINPVAAALPSVTVPGLEVSGGRPWFDVTAFGADPTGTADSTAAIQAAITAAVGSSNPATTVRLPKGPVYLPAGTYKISSDLTVLSVYGLQFTGAGAETTILECTGHAFTNAAIYINGANACVFGGFTILGDGTEGTAGTGAGGGIPNALWLTWDGGVQSEASTSGTTLRNIRTRNLKWFTGINISPTGGSYQVDGSLLIDVLPSGGQTINSWSNSGFWQKGFQIGSGFFGNAYDHTLVSVAVVGCYYGLYCNVSGYNLLGAQLGANYCDFYFIEPNAQCGISSVQSQNSQVFVQGTATAAVPEPVSFRDCKFAQGSPNVAPPSNQPVSFSGTWTGNVLFENVTISTGTLYSPVISLGSTYAAPGGVYTFISLSMASSPSAGFLINTASNASPSVTLVNYQQVSLSTGAPIANFPLVAWGGSGSLMPGITSSLGEVAITGTASLAVADYGVMHSCALSSSAYTVTLPTPAGSGGQQIGIRVTPASTKLLTLATAAGNIDGQSTRIMWAGETAILESDGTNWCKIAGKTIPMTGMMTIAASTVTVASGSVTNIPLTTTLTDNTGLMCSVSNTYITAVRAGNYQVTARVAWPSMPANSARTITVAYISGTSGNTAAQDERNAVTGGFPCISAVGEVALATGAYVTLSALQQSGSTLTLTAGTSASPGAGTVLSLAEIPSW